MVAFRGLQATQIGKILILGYLAFLVVTFTAQSFGIIDPKTNLGIGFPIIAAGIGMMAAYVIVVKKNLSLTFNEILTTLILGGILIGVMVYLPDFSPEVYEASISGLRAPIQSIFGI